MESKFRVDIEKVASASSSAATPRTGGGTARSSDGKGTPRDCERLPLGAWPRGERPERQSQAAASSHVPRLGLNQPQTPPLPGSPLTSWRSGAVSSPASSQLSARDSQDVFPPPAHQPYSARRDRVITDLSREIDAVRSTIHQESRLLRSQLSQIADDAGRFRAACVASGNSAPRLQPEVLQGECIEPAPRKKGIIEWLIEGVEAPKGPEKGVCATTTVELPEYPEITFKLRFGAAKASGEPCQLRLRFQGPGCEQLQLCVGLSASRLGDSPDAPSVVLGEASQLLVSGGMKAACACAWPQGPSATATVLCRATVELESRQPSRLSSACNARPFPALGDAE